LVVSNGKRKLSSGVPARFAGGSGVHPVTGASVAGTGAPTVGCQYHCSLVNGSGALNGLLESVA
jgi:hypothetical protein